MIMQKKMKQLLGLIKKAIKWYLNKTAANYCYLGTGFFPC